MSKQRLAVCVGLNYPGTSAALNGCLNDMRDWALALSEHGYSTRNLVEPTKAELVAELRGLIARARFGDRIVFTYSGHGTWVADRDGDEPDGRDEALVCKDYTSGGLLIDDEIQQIFGEARFGVRRLIVSDSCHSGSVSRFAGVVSKDSGARARFLPPIEFMDGAELERARAAESTPMRGTSRKGTVLLSGCADTEYSYDASFDGRPAGAMSHFALAELKRATTLREWHQRIRTQLPSAQYPQSPQLTVLKHQLRWAPV